MAERNKTVICPHMGVMKQFKTSGKEEGKNPKMAMKEKRASNEVLKSRVLKKAFKGDKDNTIQSCRRKPTNVV